jgi:hypothetical protein
MHTHTPADDKFVLTLTEATAGDSVYFRLSVISALRKATWYLLFRLLVATVSHVLVIEPRSFFATPVIATPVLFCGGGPFFKFLFERQLSGLTDFMISLGPSKEILGQQYKIYHVRIFPNLSSTYIVTL